MPYSPDDLPQTVGYSPQNVAQAASVASPPPFAPPASAVETAGNRRGYGRWWVLLAILLMALLTVAAASVPVPYVATTPGPTFDLKHHDGEPEIIAISGQDPVTGSAVTLDEDEPADPGELHMVTISEYGGPGTTLTLFDLLRFQLDGVSQIDNYEDIYPSNITPEQVEELAKAQMTSSHSTSAVAALEELGWSVPATVTIIDAVAESGAVGKVREGDELISVTTPDGVEHRINTASGVFALMGTQPPDTPLKVTVRRDGKLVTEEIVSGESPDGYGSKLGIYLNTDIRMPLDVQVHLEEVGGPSAGMMFALSIIDRLTPGDLTGGVSIAGTGALGYDGRVQPIGGLPQKIEGAKRSGVEWFLAPSANCDELTKAPTGINVVRVEDLKEARAAVDAIAQGTTENLPACYVKSAA